MASSVNIPIAAASAIGVLERGCCQRIHFFTDSLNPLRVVAMRNHFGCAILDDFGKARLADTRRYAHRIRRQPRIGGAGYLVTD